MDREYKTLTALRNNEIVNLDGLRFRIAKGEIKVGDLYIAERNTGPKLLTAKFINIESGWIGATTHDYPFNIDECVKVEEV